MGGYELNRNAGVRIDCDSNSAASHHGEGGTTVVDLHLLEVGRAGFNPLPIRVNGLSGDIQLSCDIEDHLLRGGAEVIGGEAQIAEGAELERKA